MPLLVPPCGSQCRPCGKVNCRPPHPCVPVCSHTHEHHEHPPHPTPSPVCPPPSPSSPPPSPSPSPSPSPCDNAECTLQVCFPCGQHMCGVPRPRICNDDSVCSGALGEEGDDGLCGEKGRPGCDGGRGPNGYPGFRGGDGGKGGGGKRGRRGERGDKGYEGDPGTGGPEGGPGPVGFDGRRGRKGKPGGTGDEGDDGDPGSTGPDGEKGKDGGRGRNGPKGDRGPGGFKGGPGKLGRRGDTGDEGEPGKRGKKGRCGHHGHRGGRGEDGGDGRKGPDGPDGRKGKRGGSGRGGAKGLDGAQGLPGLDGGKGKGGPEGDANTSLLLEVNRLAARMETLEALTSTGSAEFAARGDVSLSLSFSSPRRQQPFRVVRTIEAAENNVPDQEVAKLVGSGRAGTSSSQGRSVAVSADGSTMAVGGHSDDEMRGAVWIFVRRRRHDKQQEEWVPQGRKLTAPPALANAGGGEFGYSVALSDNGNTLVVGEPRNNERVGAAYVFVRSTDTLLWVQQGGKLASTSAIGAAQQGECVAVSGDGDTLVVGGSHDNGMLGAAWVRRRVAEKWGAAVKVVPHSVVPNSRGHVRAATSVALSGDAGTLALGASADGTLNHGATYVFQLDHSGWAQQAKLIGRGVVGVAMQGTSVALDVEGRTLAVGGAGDNYSRGAAWLFVADRLGRWTQQGEKLASPGGVSKHNTGASSSQGASVSLRGDGNLLAVGAPSENASLGAVYLWKRTFDGKTLDTGVWRQHCRVQSARVAGADSSIGTSVSLSRNGDTLSVGGMSDETFTGAAWAYTATQPASLINVYSSQNLNQ